MPLRTTSLTLSRKAQIHNRVILCGTRDSHIRLTGSCIAGGIRRQVLVQDIEILGHGRIH